jgi:hypothetical protein
VNLTTKRTRKREFLVQMDRVMPWAALVELIAPHACGVEAPVLYRTGSAAHSLRAWVLDPLKSVFGGSVA